MIRFTFLASLAVCSVRALRPGNPKLLVDSRGQKVGGLIMALCDGLGSLVKSNAVHPDLHAECLGAARTLAEATDREAGSALLEEGSDQPVPMDPAAIAHLQSIIETIQITIFSSMDLSHKADNDALAHAAAAILDCKLKFDERNSPGPPHAGDIYTLQQQAEEYQAELTRLTILKEVLIGTNRTLWQELKDWSGIAPDVPPCAAIFEAQEVLALEAWFEADLYEPHLDMQEQWFHDLNASYTTRWEAADDAHHQLLDTIEHAHTANVTLRTEYCMWAMVLKTACRAMTDCYEEKVAHYRTLETTARANEANRKAAYISGQTVIEHVKFLTGLSDLPEDIDVDTSVYNLDYPLIPAMATCDESSLSGAHWDDYLACPDGHTPNHGYQG